MATILIVDDDPMVARTLQRIVGAEGHDGVLAANGREALDVMSRIEVSLLITDINMRDVDGIELILALRDRGKALPVIAISGGGALDADTLLEDARALGADTTLRKPFAVDDVRTAVEELLGSRGDEAA